MNAWEESPPKSTGQMKKLIIKKEK